MSDRINRILPYAALVAACALVVVLAVQKRARDNEVTELRRLYQQAMREPQRGMYMPAFNTATLEGEPVTIGSLPAEGRQVLLVYTTTCRFCLASLPAWKQLTATLDTMTSPRVQVYGVSLDSVGVTRAYSARHALPYRTVRFPEAKLESMYRASAVPLTLVLDEQGRTVYSRLGQLSEQAAIDSVIAAVKWKPQPPPARPAAGEPGATAARS